MTSDDERAADALRRALAREAAQVSPSGDGLERIRARTAGRRRASAWLPLAAAAASVAVIGGVGWAASTGGDDAPSASDGSTGGPTALSTLAPEGNAIALPVYYVGAQGGDGTGEEFRLFREFHPTTTKQTPDAETRVELALQQMFADSAADPDYHEAAWPRGIGVEAASIDETTRLITVDLAGVDAAALGRQPSDARSSMSVQQLVFTATAAASVGSGSTDVPFGVQILVDGEQTDELLGTPAREPLHRDTAAARAAIWILSFQENDTLVNPITVTGEANLPAQGVARWDLARDGVDILSGEFRTATCCSWQPFDVVLDELTLTPGRYELRVYDAGTALADSKAFTIEGPSS